MVGLTITDDMADEMEEDFDAACASLERIINRQHERIVELEYVVKTLIGWWDKSAKSGVLCDILKAEIPSLNHGEETPYLHQIAAMAKRAMKP